MLYKPVWEYVPLNQYERPNPPAREAMRNGVVSFWKRLHPVNQLNLMRRKELQSIPPYLLNRAAPVPDSNQVMHALDMALQGWRQSKEVRQTVQVIVGPPGSGVAEVVTELAKNKGWQIVGAPTTSQILEDGSAWLANVMEDNLTPLVIPWFGKCFLRHQEGLTLMSRLVDWLQGTKRRCLIACDSWAWAYLIKALQIDVMLPIPLTLAPFDGTRLQFWLPSLARRIHQGRFVFRDLSNGQPIFPMAEQYASDMKHIDKQESYYGDWVSVSYFIRQLAAYSRGLPGVVWAIWRECLQLSQDINLSKAARIEDLADDRFTVWVREWSQLTLPIVPAPIGTDECFILHTLLLHGDMTAQLLADLLPLSFNQVRHILHFFWEAEIVEQSDNVWRVSILAYPAVRQFLANEGYLIDRF
ncbi:MAG: hypothetical protein GY943_20435 [Chloroflexi bacterium]|nr:hypothetical protein [Chloroflexota bacterium]